MTGEFARSKAGHDKDRLYIIVGTDNDYVLLADGKLRTLANPKRKNCRHIQPIHKTLPSGYGTDEEIRRSIKLYEEEINVKSGRD